MINIRTHAESVGQGLKAKIRTMVDGVRGTGRDSVVMVRVNAECQERMGELIDAGLVNSRSEAAAYLIAVGVEARQELFAGIKSSIETIRVAKEELQKLLIDEGNAHSSTATARTDVVCTAGSDEPGKRRRARSEHTIPQKDYEFPILETLYELGGNGRSRDVLERVKHKMEHRLQAADYQTVGKGKEPRWHNLACWARSDLVKRGLLKDTSKRGIWELTDLGKAEATGEEVWRF